MYTLFGIIGVVIILLIIYFAIEIKNAPMGKEIPYVGFVEDKKKDK